MSRFLTEHEYRNIDNVYVALTRPLVYQSDLLRELGYDDDIIVAPANLVHDLESVPRYIRAQYKWLTRLINLFLMPLLAPIYWLLNDTSKRGGTIHDAGYRYDLRPEIPREVWDLIYLEIMEMQANQKWKRSVKYRAVRWFGEGSFHRHSVEATISDLRGK